MTEHKHTPEPWVCEEYNKFSDEVVITGADGSYICSIDCDGVYDELTGPKIDADARRIAACVNACKGIPNEALESGVIGELLDDHREIDETLTFALENGDMPANVRHSITVARDTARAAIAKAKGE